MSVAELEEVLAAAGNREELIQRAVALQERCRPLVSQVTPPGLTVATVAGLDVAYGDDDRLAAAVVVLDAASLEVVDRAVAHGTAAFPYVPGLFAFRELPSLLSALDTLSVAPDLLVCDGYGVAHPRRFGLASHLGLLTGIPTIGVAKTPWGAVTPPADTPGATTDLVMDGEIVGRALRTRERVKPVFVSVGHLIDLDRACAEVLRLSPRYRLPETTRLADSLSRAALAAG